jgi:hypothetical protein
MFTGWNILCRFGRILSLSAMFLILGALLETISSKRAISSSARLRTPEWSWGTPISHHTFEQSTSIFSYKYYFFGR